MAFEFDVLNIVDQVKKFSKREKGSLLGLLGMEVIAFWLWKSVLMEMVSGVVELDEILGFESVYLVLGFIFVGWIWSRRIVIPSKKMTIGIAPFGMIAIKKDLSGEQQFDLAFEVVEHIYTSLHHFREKWGFTDFIHFEKLPDRVKPDFDNADEWAKKLKLGILIWGNVRVEEKGMMLEPQFNFWKEPADRFYKHFKTRLNNLHDFKLEFDDDEDKSGMLLSYLIFVAMLFAGIGKAHEGKYERAEEIFEKTMGELGKTRNKKNQTLHDVLVTLEFFRARNLHVWGNEMLEDGDKKGAIEKWKQAEKLLFVRADEMKKELFGKKDWVLWEKSWLYGVYLLAKEGKVKEAEKKLAKVKKQMGGSGEYFLTLAKVKKLVDPEKAEEYFKKAMGVAKDKHLLSEAEEELGEFLLKEKKWKQAAKVLEMKFGQDEKRIYEPELWDDAGRRELAQAYLQQHRWIRAQKELVMGTWDFVRNEKKEKLVI